MIFLIITLMLFVPIVSAQTYSGFDRFGDNVKLFFSSGDNKVMLALGIREKEVTSAIENIQSGNGEGSTQNLLEARKKLRIVQEKVSFDVADEVKTSVDEIKNKIDESEGLSKDFELYSLEEEKTKLKAELVVVVEGKEGQTKIREIEGQIGEVNNEIKGWVVENTIAEGNGESGSLTWEVRTDIDSGDYGGDDGLTPEIKTYTAGDGTQKDEALSKPDLNKINPDLYDPNARAPGDTIDETYDDEVVNGGGANYAEGTTAGGALDDAQDSSGDNSASNVVVSTTGEVIKDDKNSDSTVLKKIFAFLFGR